MTFEEFDKYQQKLLAQVVIMKNTKGKEYANSEDRFANFNRLADRLNISNLKIALVYLTKHMDAIESYISRGRTYSTETIEGRIVDAITYLTLIAGMIAETSIPSGPLDAYYMCGCGKYNKDHKWWLDYLEGKIKDGQIHKCD